MPGGTWRRCTTTTTSTIPQSYVEQVIGIELPLTVDMKITACDPAVKGNSATARTKKAYLETGHEVQIPEHLSPGEVVRVDTSTGKFVCRVNK